MSAGRSKYQTGGSPLDQKPSVGVPGGNASSLPQTLSENKPGKTRDEHINCHGHTVSDIHELT